MDNPLYREARKFSRFEAWIDMMMNANGIEKEVIFDGKPLLIKRGQLLTSQRKLGEKWGWSKTKTRDFLNSLQNHAHCIEIISDRKKSIITLLNYERYNPQSETKKTTEIEDKKTSERPRKDHGLVPTNKRIKKDNKGKAIYHENFQRFVSHWNSMPGLRALQVRESKEKQNTERELEKVLKDYSFDDVVSAVDNYSKVISNPEDYFFNYSWSSALFLKRGLSRFLSTSIPLVNLRKNRFDTFRRDFIGQNPKVEKTKIERDFDKRYLEARKQMKEELKTKLGWHDEAKRARKTMNTDKLDEVERKITNELAVFSDGFYEKNCPRNLNNNDEIY